MGIKMWKSNKNHHDVPKNIITEVQVLSTWFVSCMLLEAYYKNRINVLKHRSNRSPCYRFDNAINLTYEQQTHFLSKRILYDLSSFLGADVHLFLTGLRIGC